MSQGKKLTKVFWYKKFLTALSESVGSIASTCKKLGIAPQTYYDYRRRDEEFSKEVEMILDRVCIPFLEDIALQHAKNGNVALIKFFLQNRGGSRWNQRVYEEQIGRLIALLESKDKDNERMAKLYDEQRPPTEAERVAALAYEEAMERYLWENGLEDEFGPTFEA